MWQCSRRHPDNHLIDHHFYPNPEHDSRLLFSSQIQILTSLTFTGGSERETEPHRAVVEGERVGQAGGRQSSDYLPERYQRGLYFTSFT